MNGFNATLAVLIGAIVRLAIPILITALAVYFLKSLDEYWQRQAKKEGTRLKVEKPRCWDANDCPPGVRSSCPGYLSPLPCWQVYRLSNGYLRQACLDCKVFRGAPALVHV